MSGSAAGEKKMGAKIAEKFMADLCFLPLSRVPEK
jgi:hypothetical protein